MSDPKWIIRIPPGATRLAGVGVELGATVVGACLLGYWIDGRLNTAPWALLICGILGVVGGLYNVIRRAVRELAKAAEHNDKQRKTRSGGKADS